MQNGDRLERLRGLSPAKRALLLKKLAQPVQDSAKVPAITRRRQQGPAVLSFAQQQLFYLYLLDPKNPAYNVPIMLRLIGTLDVFALIESIKTIIQRHEILRTTITIVDGQPVQVVAPTLILTPQIIDVSTYPKADQVQAIDHAIAAEFSTPFDLTRGPLIRVTLLRLSDTEHVFLFNMHHIISDGWSIGILMQELNVLYLAIIQGNPCPLAVLPVQYADYAIWQRQWMQGAVRDNQLAYWRQHLANAPTLLNLPTDHPRPGVQSYRGGDLSFRIPEEVRTALHQLSQTEGVTLFMTLLAAFQVLLYRYSGQEDFLVGTPTANRTREETEGLIGCFINTLVLRSNLAGNPSFRTLLQKVRQECLEAYAYQELPFELLVEALQPERTSSYNPLFQVMFALQNAPDTSLSLPGLSVQPMEGQGQSSKFDLTLSMTEGEQVFEGVLEYNSDLFERSTIERLREHFLILLQGIVVAPDRRVTDLPLLTPQEEHYLLHEVNSLFSMSVPPLCLHQLFEAQVEQTPDATAVLYADERLTYQKLNQRANQLAHHLQTMGVGPDVLVGLCVERSLEMVVGLLGILKAGGAYVPLDPTYPKERLAFMVGDAQVGVLVTQQRQEKQFAGSGAGLVLLDSDHEELAQQNPTNPINTVSATNLAYVIYTSGSTGQPKGAMIPHQGLVNYLCWCTRAYAVEQGQAVPVHSSLSFDLTITSLFSPLLVGGYSILLPEEQGVEALGACLRTTKSLSLIKVTPAHLELLSQQLLPHEVAGRANAFIIGGEALRQEHLAFWRTHAPQTRFINEYGPTETVVGCCIYEVAQEDTFTGPIPIGRPIANTQLYLLDQHLYPVPIGAIGELYIGGDGLARGYLRHPELTAERFVPHPYSNESGARLYRTGDLARYRKDGSIEFIGRNDQQIKLRGYRIELGEIEAALTSHPAVRETIVLVHEELSGDKRLIAYVVPVQSLTSRDLRSYLQGRLPEYMVPTAFVLLEALPLTANGKVDRHALSAFYKRDAVLSQNLIGPRDIIELRLVQLWEKVLQAAPISILDNFFDLGGHSLLAIQLVTQMQQQFDCKIPLSVLIQNGTIEHIAHLIRAGSDAIHQSPLVLLQSAGHTSPFFCVHPAGGSVLCYVDLARHLDRPFYGLQAEGLYEGEIQPRSVGEMATQYIAAIQSVQPHGPYLLGGWSLGGAVAFEMAQQLMAQGQDVAALVLIDSVIPALTTDAPEDVSPLDMLLSFALHLGVSQEYLNSVQCTLAPLPWDEQWTSLVAQMKNLGIIPADSDGADLQRLFLVHQTTIQAWLHYQPHQYQGSLTLLRASDRTGWNDSDPTMGWQHIVAGHLTVIDTPGDHYTLMRQPHVLSLAEHLRQYLDATLEPDQQTRA